MSRSEDRLAFLHNQGLSDATISALPQDASARRYFRISQGHETLLLMDAPPDLENPAQFMEVTAYLQQLGARVPAIVASDLSGGWILLEDLGNQTMAELLANGVEESTLYKSAVNSLLGIQHGFENTDVDIALPYYDLDAILAEVTLFIEWYLPTRLRRKLEQLEWDEYRDIWSSLYNKLPAIKPVLVHRDFHIDNLIMVGESCAMLDYQDALLGSPVYDLVSLLEDARRDVSPELQIQLIDYWLGGSDIERESFISHYNFWGAQRHCKVAGIFIRLWQRDNKGAYLDHIPRVTRLLAKNLESPGLVALRSWLDNILPGPDDVAPK